MQTIQACSFTGHRPKSFSFGADETSAEFAEFYQRLRNTIIQVCNAGCRRFYCGMAEGVDLWCAEIVLSLRDHFRPALEIIPVVPYFAQPDTMSKINKERYRAVMDASSERFLVSRRFTKSCFLKRNQFLVDSADALIAVLKKGEERSGTGQTVRYATKKKKTIFLIDV